MLASVLACYFLRFIDKTKIFFNSCDFVFPMCKTPIDDLQYCLHIFENTLEPTAVIDNNNLQTFQTRERNSPWKVCEIFRMCFRSNSRDYKCVNHTLRSVDGSLLNYLKDMYLDPRGRCSWYRKRLSLVKKNDLPVYDFSIHYMIGSGKSLWPMWRHQF